MSDLTVILPCAGEGTRLSLPYPKEVHSIEKNKSLIDYSFDLFSNYGRRDVEFVITLNENKTELVKYLSRYKSRFNISFTYFNLQKLNIQVLSKVLGICLVKRILFFFQILS